jgi:hypothetical protein
MFLRRHSTISLRLVHRCLISITQLLLEVERPRHLAKPPEHRPHISATIETPLRHPHCFANAQICRQSIWRVINTCYQVRTPGTVAWKDVVSQCPLLVRRQDFIVPGSPASSDLCVLHASVEFVFDNQRSPVSTPIISEFSHMQTCLTYFEITDFASMGRRVRSRRQNSIARREQVKTGKMKRTFNTLWHKN